VKKESKNILYTSLPLFSASFLAQGINFLLFFLLPFLFDADDIGGFFVFLAVAQILIPLVSLQSHNAIVLSRSDVVAVSNLVISIGIGALFSFFLFLLAYFLYLFPYSWSEVGMKWILFLPVYVFSVSVIVSFEQYLTYLGDYRLLGYLRLVKAVFVMVPIFIGGFIFPGVEVLVLGHFVGQVVGILLILWVLKPPFAKVIVSKMIVRLFVLRHRKILTFNTLIVGILMLINHSPALLLSFYFGDKVVALYGIVQRVFSAIPGALGQSVTQIFFKKCSQLYNTKKPVYGTAVRTIKQMGGWYLGYGVISMLVAPFVFYELMEPGWEDAAVITRILLPLILIQTISIPFTTLFTIFKNQRRVIWFYLGGFLVRIVLGLIVPLEMLGAGFKEGLIVYSATGLVYYFFYLRELLLQAKRNDINLNVSSV
jgi:O-antigen/teichoic acid export membrane protein